MPSSAGADEETGRYTERASVPGGQDVLRARNRSSERTAIALIRRTETVRRERECQYWYKPAVRREEVQIGIEDVRPTV